MNSLKTDDFDFELDESLIAQFPLKDRSSSKLLVVNRENFDLEHKNFKNIVDYIKKDDVLVINDTKVIPARLFGARPGKDEAIEVLLLKKHEDNTWETLVKPGKKMKIGSKVEFGNGKLLGEVVGISEEGERFVKFSYDGIFDEKLEEKDRYQTVYAKHNGSAAAPTAGLHFTDELLKELKEKGVKIARITLHVGLGTFRPVKVDDVNNHHMHTEWYEVNAEAADIINETKRNGGRVICVGTTSCRTIESVADENGYMKAKTGETDIFIYPGYKFKVMDGLITNFHLPESTLVMLVSAFAGKENVLAAYETAVKERYRFFSFGDAMILI